MSRHRIVFHHARASPDLDPPPRGEIEQEQIGAVVVGKIADGDVLPVAGIIGNAQRPLVEHLDEALGAAAMLDIGRAGCGDRGQERGVEAGDEGRELRGNPVGKTRRDALCIEVCRPTLRLRASRRGGKDDVAVIGDDVACRWSRGPPDHLLRPQNGHSPGMIIGLSSQLIIAIYATVWTGGWHCCVRRGGRPRQLCGGRAAAGPLAGRGHPGGRGIGVASRRPAAHPHHARGRHDRGGAAVSGRRQARARRSRGDRTGGGGRGHGAARRTAPDCADPVRTAARAADRH